eukprot:5995658-Alexandrium_andersonii.AAC.1
MSPDARGAVRSNARADKTTPLSGLQRRQRQQRHGLQSGVHYVITEGAPDICYELPETSCSVATVGYCPVRLSARTQLTWCLTIATYHSTAGRMKQH